MRLLVEEIAPRPELCERLVVAYLPGMPVFESALRTALEQETDKAEEAAERRRSNSNGKGV